jgi:hypothetical protein
MDFFKEEKNKGEYHNKFSFVFFLKVKKKKNWPPFFFE